MRIDAKASGTDQGSHRSQLTAGTHEAVFVPDPSDIFSIVSICVMGRGELGGIWGVVKTSLVNMQSQYHLPPSMSVQ